MLNELMKRKADLEAEIQVLHEKYIAPIQEMISAVNIDIEHMVAGKLADLRKLQAKEFGAVNITLDGYKVTETVPKRVEWDQTKLDDLFRAITTAGDEPRNYMKVEFKVGEKEFNAFVPEVRAMFSDARTVTPGRPSLKFESLEV